MKSSGMLLANGRSKSDSPAHYTYIGENGKSIIDLACIKSQSANLLHDFEVINDFHVSYHLPGRLTLNSDLPPRGLKSTYVAGN